MKLNRKIAIAFTAVIFSFALLFLLFENLFLDSFYMLQKKSNLHSAYNEVESYISSLDSNIVVETSEILMEIGDISRETNTTIFLFDVNGNNYDARPNALFKNLRDINLTLSVGDSEKTLETKNDFEQMIPTEATDITPKNQDSTHKDIGVIGKLEKNSETCGYVYVFTSYTSIRDNVGIFNIFTIYVTLILVVVACCISYFISSGLTRPIKDVQRKARKMANLDFSTKLEVKSKDEISELAISINKMSDELEKSINDLKKANKKLEEDIKLKEKINRLREEFISDVSHELKTPISIVGGYSEALKLEGLSREDINSYADIIIDESKRMNKLVKDLLKFTQIESGFMSLDKENFNVTEMLNEVIKPNNLRLEEKNITLHFECPDVVVNGDYDMLETVFNNFYVNAINHVDNERIISVIGEIKENKLRINVSNTGLTISPENQARIWDSFYKIDKSRSRQYGGSGLGLSIVKSIMVAYNNKYGVFNTENGVTFYFDLNIAETK